MSDPSTNTVQVTLKWSKQTFQLTINRDESALSFKQNVHELTGVPIPRQKLLAKKGGWKGSLKDDYPMNTLDSSLSSLPSRRLILLVLQLLPPR